MRPAYLYIIIHVLQHRDSRHRGSGTSDSWVVGFSEKFRTGKCLVVFETMLMLFVLHIYIYIYIYIERERDSIDSFCLDLPRAMSARASL